MRLDGKIALITGGSSGIGFATAKRFVAEGAAVVITGRRADALDEAVRQLGSNALAAEGDVTDIDGLNAAATLAADRFGGLHVVFANAGVAGATPVASTHADAIRRILDINVVGAFLTVQAALPHLSEGASVVLNGSVQAVLGLPGSSGYAASKAGVRAMTRSLAAELAPRGIRVNAVVPGATRTPIWSDRAPPEEMARFEEEASRGIPFARFGEPDEVANAVLFLASDEASYVTAAELVVDGGLTGAPAGGPIFRR